MTKLVRKMRRKLWIERDYKGFMRRKQGQKFIRIFRVLAKSISTIEEIRFETGYSRSEIYKLLNLAEQHRYVSLFSRGKMRSPRGKHPATKGFEKETGRPPSYYVLTPKSLSLMRFDPELADEWKLIEKTYGFYERNILDSYSNLKHAIQEHQVLGKLERPYYFDGELQRTLLNPFLFKRGLGEEQVNELSDELVRLIHENVIPEHIKNYVSTLQDSVARLEKTIQRHKLLIEKMKSLKP